MPETGQYFLFRLRISRDAMLEYYRGTAATVQVVSENGRRVRFPANILRPFITAQGVRGHFRLRVDDCNRVLGLERLGD